MADTAKLFMHGRSQAVRLPRACRMPGTEVRVSKVGNRVILEPITPETTTTPWDVIDSLGDRPFMPDGREQPAMPADRPVFER
jgi:antitoxin VapB